MNKQVLSASLILCLLLSAGCSHRREEVDARLSGAEDMATAARVHSDESALKADRALREATEAKKSADQAKTRAQPAPYPSCCTP
ncbi:hypothetical protein GGD92_04720 [Pseudomonas protegens]|uniref:Lipoprotein n=1 Tax=Pseudomonas protegens TaxID=380021 RepID=A0A7G7XC78_9PSED|nr:hypothetical protein [Pseudomonas protegens]QNH77573.1 hypothetical protein GGI48_30855 [Pseudomonas protegens]QNL06769.1 hypothetical protein GGD92_04720 [Pseudomonas protegens]